MRSLFPGFPNLQSPSVSKLEGLSFFPQSRTKAVSQSQSGCGEGRKKRCRGHRQRHRPGEGDVRRRAGLLRAVRPCSEEHALRHEQHHVPQLLRIGPLPPHDGARRSRSALRGSFQRAPSFALTSPWPRRARFLGPKARITLRCGVHRPQKRARHSHFERRARFGKRLRRGHLADPGASVSGASMEAHRPLYRCSGRVPHLAQPVIPTARGFPQEILF
jgi:hypothetical protein